MSSIRGVHGLARGARTPADNETEKSSASSSKGQMRPDEGQAYPSASVKSDSYELPELPPGSSSIELVQRRGELLSEEVKAKAWSDAASMVKSYSDELVDRWNKEIDTYLVYAGLFSAILTAFSVESYSLLQPPAPDQTMAALERISLQLSSFAFNAPFMNSTQSPFIASPDVTPAVPRNAVWLNALWFSALILSLASASLSIMVKQWLNQFQSGLSGTSRQIARLRQYRLDNVVKWRVADIVTVIPFLLQLALGLFLAGLLTLLWTLHDAVAAVATVLVSLIALSTVGGIVLPLFKRGCAYITPQTLVLYSVWKTVSHALYKPQHRSTESTMTWEGQERHAVHPALLDPVILASAYKYTLNSDALAVAAKCLTDCSPVEVGNYLRMLHGAILTHFGHTVELARAWTPVKPSHTQLLLWAQAMLFTLWAEHPRPAGWDLGTQATLANVLGYWLSQPERGLSSSPDDTPAEWLLAMLSTLAEYLQEEGEGREEIQSVIECLYDARSRLLGWAKEVDVDSSAATPLAVTQARRDVIRRYHDIEKTGNIQAFLDSVGRLMECGGSALSSSLPAREKAGIRSYVRETLVELVRVLPDTSTSAVELLRWINKVGTRSLGWFTCELVLPLARIPDVGQVLPEGLLLVYTRIVELLLGLKDTSVRFMWSKEEVKSALQTLTDTVNQPAESTTIRDGFQAGAPRSRT